MSERDAMLSRAEEHLLAAEACLAKSLLNPAYELARTAAELYAKTLLLGRTKDYPREHNVAGELQHQRLVPRAMSPAKLSRFLDDHTRGGYGFDQPVEAREVRAAIDMARQLAAAAKEGSTSRP